MSSGPLRGVRIVEIAGLGPGPFAAMLLADLGADIIRVERKEGIAAMKMMGMDPTKDISNRGRSAIALDQGSEEHEHARDPREVVGQGVDERLGL